MTSNETLEEYFGQYGELSDHVVMKHTGSSENRGFGFVTFKNMKDRNKCLEDKPHTLDGKTVNVYGAC